MFTLRPFQPSDTSGVWQLHLAAMEAEPASLEESFFADLRDILEHYVASGGEFLIGTVNDDMVACGGYIVRSSAEIEIKRMRVHPRHQRMGYGRAVLNALEASAKDRGFKAARVETTTTQQAALSLYESTGYLLAAETQVRGFDVLQFVKRLVSTHSEPTG